MPRGEYELEIISQRGDDDWRFENAEQFGEQVRHEGTDEVVTKLTSMLEREPAHPSHAQTLAARLDRLDLDDESSDPIAEVFRDDLSETAAAVIAHSGHADRDESVNHVIASIADALHEYLETEVPEAGLLDLPADPLTTLEEGGDCTGRTVLYGSLLASAGIPFRSTSIGGGYPHSLLEVGFPCSDLESVPEIVAAIEDVVTTNGITNPTIYWRYWDAVDALFVPACTLYSEYPGDVAPLEWHGYVDHPESGEQPDRKWGIYGTGPGDTGTWAWSTVLDVLGHYYDGEDLVHLGSTTDYTPSQVRTGDATDVLAAARAQTFDPAALPGSAGEKRSLPSCPNCQTDLSPIAEPNYCFECGTAL
jgi:hypothetical protein